ncbi:MAG TPA: hypothetical protein V6D43_19835 [Candidatus Sericytochromatia bacterium]
MNKKFVRLALILTLVTTLGACNQGTGEGGAGSSPGASPSPTAS